MKLLFFVIYFFLWKNKHTYEVYTGEIAIVRKSYICKHLDLNRKYLAETSMKQKKKVTNLSEKLGISITNFPIYY